MGIEVELSPSEGRRLNQETKESENGKEAVINAFREFGLEMDIAKHPDLLSRLVDIGEHFHDAVEMARMIDKIWDKLSVDDADYDNLLTATLLHDIGKAGPLKISPDSPLRPMFKKLFPHGNSEAKNFDDLAVAAGFSDSQSLAESLSGEQTPISGEMPAIDFWRYHADWTYEVLNQAGVGEEITRIAASHHILEGKNPARLADEEISSESKILEVADKYHAHGYRVLAIMDKYQAIRERGAARSHEEIIAFLHRIVDKSRVSEQLKKDYHEIIDHIFAGAKNDLEKALKK